ncbi:MAG TPA: hydrogenase maturation protease [Nitrospira sp.]|nr:hydrogenase maturation protease [Nitrospira sp.]
MKHDSPRSSSIRIIGLGNELRGDDGVGLLAVRRLRQAIGDRAEVIETEMAGVELIGLMEGARVAILIDAVQSKQSPGIIHRLDASTGPIAVTVVPHSSHAIGLSEVLELARVIGVLPPRVIVYGIEAGNLETGQALSAPVAHAVEKVVEQVIQECGACHA